MIETQFNVVLHQKALLHFLVIPTLEAKHGYDRLPDMSTYPKGSDMHCFLRLHNFIAKSVMKTSIFLSPSLVYLPWALRVRLCD